MKKPVSVLLLISLLLCSLLAVSCGGDDEFPEYTYADGKITSEDGKSYTPAPMGFQPQNVGGKCAVRDKAFDLYQVLRLDGTAVSTEDWMTEEYAGNVTSVYYGEGVTLPDFDKINFSHCYVCEEDEIVNFVTDFDDKKLIDTMIDRVANGTESTGRLDESVSSYTLKFSSDEYPGIFFSIDYLIYDDAAYLYSICSKRYAEATGLLDRYIEQPAESD